MVLEHLEVEIPDFFKNRYTVFFEACGTVPATS